MPQGVVRDDGGLTQAHALKIFLQPLPLAGVFSCLSRGKKTGSSLPAPCADEPVYRLRFHTQEGSNTHPSAGRAFSARFIAKWPQVREPGALGGGCAGLK